jgi:hypothetical protein
VVERAVEVGGRGEQQIESAAGDAPFPEPRPREGGAGNARDLCARDVRQVHLEVLDSLVVDEDKQEI